MLGHTPRTEWPPSTPDGVSAPGGARARRDLSAADSGATSSGQGSLRLRMSPSSAATNRVHERGPTTPRHPPIGYRCDLRTMAPVIAFLAAPRSSSRALHAFQRAARRPMRRHPRRMSPNVARATTSTSLGHNLPDDDASSARYTRRAAREGTAFTAYSSESWESLRAS